MDALYVLREKLSRLKPATVVQLCTPGVLRVICSTCLQISTVRSSEAAKGSCTLIYKNPWSSSGRKPEGSFFPKIPAPRATTTRNNKLNVDLWIKARHTPT